MKENCSNLDVNYSDKNSNRRTHSRKAQSAHQGSDRQIDEPSTSREMINCDNQKYDSNMLDKKSDFTDERNANLPKDKIRTWLHILLVKLCTNAYLNKDDKVSMESEITPIDQSKDDSKSVATSNAGKKKSKSRKTSKKQSSKYIDEYVKNESQTVKCSSQSKKGPRTRQSNKV